MKQFLSVPSYFLLVSTILFSSLTMAQNIKIQKVKGNRAIIETTTPLVEGEEYSLQPKKFVENVVYSNEGLRSRKNSISLGASLETIQSSSSSGEILNFQLRYGWNFTNIEVGPYVKYESNNIYGVQTSAYAVGGFMDYNLKPNRDGVMQIWGATGTFGFGGSNAGSGTGTTIMGIFAGGFYKWFVFGSQGALRSELGYKFEQRSRSSTSSSSSGLLANLLISFYY